MGKRYMLGISRSDQVVYEQVSIWEALKAGFVQTWGFIYLTILGIVKMIQQVIPASELGGPILIAQLAGKQLQAGLDQSGLFHRLDQCQPGDPESLPHPHPGRRPPDVLHLRGPDAQAHVGQRPREISQQLGLVILVSLMVFVFYNDIVRLFHQG